MYSVNMASGGRDARSAEAGPTPTAKRGRLNDRAWRDVRRAARIAREEGVSLRVHGVEVTGLLKQQWVAKRCVHVAKQQPAESAASKQASAAAGDSSQPQLSRRQQRSAQRLLEFQEKKRAQLGQTNPFFIVAKPLQPAAVCSAMDAEAAPVVDQWWLKYQKRGSPKRAASTLGDDGSAKRPVIVAPLTGELPASGTPGPAVEGGAGEGGGP